MAERVCDALGNRDAALIRNHGAVGVGADPEAALKASILTERAAQIFVLVFHSRASPLPYPTKWWLPRPPYSRCEGLPDARKCARLIVTDSTLSRTRIWFPYPDFSFVVCT